MKSVVTALVVASFASALAFAPVVRSPGRMVPAPVSMQIGHFGSGDILPGGSVQIGQQNYPPQRPQRGGAANRLATIRQQNYPNAAPAAPAAPPAAPLLPERVEALCRVLDIHGAQTLIEQVDSAVGTIGLQKELDELPLEQKVDACFHEIRPIVGAVEALMSSLNMTKSPSLVETLDRAVHAIGLGQDVAALPLPQKVEACLETLGTPPDGAPMAGGYVPTKGQIVRDRAVAKSVYGGYGGGNPYGYGGVSGYIGPYTYKHWGTDNYGPTRLEARAALRQGHNVHDLLHRGYNVHDLHSASGYYAAYNYPGGRQDRLYDRALYTWSYDPYNAVGESWDAWIDFFG